MEAQEQHTQSTGRRGAQHTIETALLRLKHIRAASLPGFLPLRRQLSQHSAIRTRLRTTTGKASRQRSLRTPHPDSRMAPPLYMMIALLTHLALIILLCTMTASQEAHAAATATGAPACAAPGAQTQPAICVGPQGRILLAWIDARVPTVHNLAIALRESTDHVASGWNADGDLCPLPQRDIYRPMAASLSNGWAAIAWTERNPTAFGGDRIRLMWFGLSSALVLPPAATPVDTVEGSSDPALLMDATPLDDSALGMLASRSTEGRLYVDLLKAEATGGPNRNAFSVRAIHREGADLLPAGLASDGRGGAFVLSRLVPSATTFLLHRVGPHGETPAGAPAVGLPIELPTTWSYSVHLSADHSGGCYLAWSAPDTANTERVHLARVDSLGSSITYIPVPPPNAPPLVNQRLPRVAPTASGVAVLSAIDSRDNCERIAVQLVNPDGTTPKGWPSDGVLIGSTTNEYLLDYRILAAPGGRILLAWSDRRGPTGAPENAYLAAIDSLGLPLGGYALAGIAPFGTLGERRDVCLAEDPNTSFPVVACADYRADLAGDIYFAKLDGQGVVPTLPEYHLAGWSSSGGIVTTDWLTTSSLADVEAQCEADGRTLPRDSIELTPTGSYSIRISARLPRATREVAITLFDRLGIEVGRSALSLTRTVAPRLQVTNPVRGQLMLIVEGAPVTTAMRVTVFDVQGRRRLAFRLPGSPQSSARHTIPQPGLPPGLYFAVLQVGGTLAEPTRFSVAP
ncbi:MAG: hypothetical protein IT348_17465 [Candidatus Eisenbacteria bacterium]|nr:hypothetical protein [Candidatus Eisenbacteria bacterium]